MRNLSKLLLTLNLNELKRLVAEDHKEVRVKYIAIRKVFKVFEEAHYDYHETLIEEQAIDESTLFFENIESWYTVEMNKVRIYLQELRNAEQNGLNVQENDETKVHIEEERKQREFEQNEQLQTEKQLMLEREKQLRPRVIKDSELGLKIEEQETKEQLRREHLEHSRCEKERVKQKERTWISGEERQRKLEHERLRMKQKEKLKLETEEKRRVTKEDIDKKEKEKRMRKEARMIERRKREEKKRRQKEKEMKRKSLEEEDNRRKVEEERLRKLKKDKKREATRRICCYNKVRRIYLQTNDKLNMSRGEQTFGTERSDLITITLIEPRQ